jgi:hypothetical protein
MDTGNPTISMFSNEEEARLASKTILDETDRKILALILIHPKWSNEEIGEEIGLNRIQVWRRRTKGPLATVLLEFQKEALNSASDLVIQEARGAVRALGELARGECDCPPMVREQAENHRMVCLTPVPYAVRRAAAKDLIEILQNRPKEEGETEEDVWEAQVTSVGGISMKKLKGVIDIPVSKEEEDEKDN